MKVENVAVILIRLFLFDDNVMVPICRFEFRTRYSLRTEILNQTHGIRTVSSRTMPRYVRD